MESKRVDVDEMLSLVGCYGRYQKIVNTAFCIIVLPQTMQILIMYFAALSPSWKCNHNSTICNSTEIFESSNKKRCSMNRVDWDYTEPKTFSVATQFDLVCENEWWINLTSSIFFIGWMCGAIVFGWVADKYGRRIVYFPCTVLLITAGFLTAFSPNILILTALRFVAGLFYPGTTLQSIILMSELVDPDRRAFASLIIFVFYTFALCFVGVKAYFIRTWKLLFISCTVPYVFVFLFFPLVPESIRWLMANGESEKLKTLFVKISKWNRREIPKNVELKCKNVQNDSKSSLFIIFQTKKQLISTLIQGYVWMVNAMAYFGLSLAADDLGGNLYLTYVLVSFVEIPGIATTIYFSNKYGRKKTGIISLFLAGLFCLPISFIPDTGHIKILRVALGMSGKYFICVSYNCIYNWSIELYPTLYRSKGMGFLQITSRVGAAISPFIAKSLKIVHHSFPFFLMGGMSLVGAALEIFLRETKGLKGEESVNDMELKDVSDVIENKAAIQKC